MANLIDQTRARLSQYAQPKQQPAGGILDEASGIQNQTGRAGTGVARYGEDEDALVREALTRQLGRDPGAATSKKQPVGGATKLETGLEGIEGAGEEEPAPDNSPSRDWRKTLTWSGVGELGGGFNTSD